MKAPKISAGLALSMGQVLGLDFDPMNLEASFLDASKKTSKNGGVSKTVVKNAAYVGVVVRLSSAHSEDLGAIEVGNLKVDSLPISKQDVSALPKSYAVAVCRKTENEMTRDSEASTVPASNSLSYRGNIITFPVNMKAYRKRLNLLV